MMRKAEGQHRGEHAKFNPRSFQFGPRRRGWKAGSITDSVRHCPVRPVPRLPEDFLGDPLPRVLGALSCGLAVLTTHVGDGVAS